MDTHEQESAARPQQTPALPITATFPPSSSMLPPSPSPSPSPSSAASVSIPTAAIDNHSYWSGFYKKTVKERRTQLGLAFPHLNHRASLESFASNPVSAKTSGQSTPSLGPFHGLAMTSIVPPISLSKDQRRFGASGISPSPCPQEPLSSSLDDPDESMEDSVNSTPRKKVSLSNLRASLGSKPRAGLEDRPLPAISTSSMTAAERRDQLERERRATVISDLEQQRRTIGTPNGSLLEGDLSLDARLDAILTAEREGAPFPVHGLDEQIANNMIENCIGTLGMPMGLAFNITINGSPYVVPMAIEEPSVVAAVSSAAKTIAAYQGFQASAPERNMIVAQVQILDILDSEMDRAVARLQEQQAVIQSEANEYCTNMVKRGGGVQRVTFHRVRRHARESYKGQNLLVKYGILPAQNTAARSLPSGTHEHRCSEWLVVHLHIDVGDAMGANCANTVAEGIAPFLAKLSGGRVGVRILSNLNVDRIAKSTFRLPFSHMAYKSLPGKDVAVRVLEAYEWADLDPYRAATHNKGIMNGIDAVALATGQDWRAIEAGAHAWASGAGTFSERSREPTVNGHSKKRTAEERDETRIYRGDAYKPLTRYWIEEDEVRLKQGFQGQDALVFCGELEMPIMVGTKGGVLSTNPVHAFTLGLMRYPDSKQLAMAMVTIGLAQNFAALRALVTEGIQRGHMALHARNIAISAGTPPASVNEVTAHMIDTGMIRLGAARSYIEKHGLGLYSHSSASSSTVTLVSNSGAGLRSQSANQGGISGSGVTATKAMVCTTSTTTTLNEATYQTETLAAPRPLGGALLTSELSRLTGAETLPLSAASSSSPIISMSP